MRPETFLLLFTVLSSFVVYTKSCSCMYQHPQTHYCKADFVILARIKRREVKNSQLVYKVRIKKPYKMSEKALTALKAGRLISPYYSSMCRINLEEGETYVISGNILSLKAHINMCTFSMPWKDLTRRQRKGFKKMYRYGCDCDIAASRTSKDACYFRPFTSLCEQEEGVCMRQRNQKCMWNRNKALTLCQEKRDEPYMNKTRHY